MAESTEDLGVQIPRWSEKMRIKDDDDDRKVLSKKLSYVLRHGAKQLDLEINEEGYARVSDLLACNELFAGVALEALMEVVTQSNEDKQRYEVLQQEDGEWLIRATGKHTMQGLARPDPRDKRTRRNSNKEAGGSPTSNADRNRGPRSPGGMRPIAEDDFCAKWRLDRFARVRLADLSPANKQLAMQRFNPGPQVPPSDYPKVFVAFCKRFRMMKGKDEKDVHDDEDFPTSPQAGRGVVSSAMSTRTRNKPAMGEAAVGLLPTGPLLDDYDSDHFENMISGSFPAYATPRSDDDHDSPQALSIQSLGTPVHHPQQPPLSPPQTQQGSPMLTMPLDLSRNQHGSRPVTMVPSMPHNPQMGSPKFTAHQKPPGAPPPPTYAPNTRLPADASFRTAPPPPTHAPQVDGYGFGSSAEQDCGYQDLSRQHHPGQWRHTAVSSTYSTGGQMQSPPQPYSTTPTSRATGPSGYQDMAMSQVDYSGGYYDARNTYVQGMPSQRYQDLPPHIVGRGHTVRDQGYATQPENANYYGAANAPTQGHRDNFVVGDWQQVHASSMHGACY